jgi:hypothetical protein
MLYFGILVVGFSWSVLPYEVIAKSYCLNRVKIDIVGSKLSMSGIQDIGVSDWARFDMAIGVDELRIESGVKNPKALPVIAIEDWESNSAYLTISIAVRLVSQNDNNIALEIIQQTGTAPGLDSDDLNSISNWEFKRECKEITVAIDSPYKLKLDDPITSDQYTIILAISGQHDTEESSDLSRNQLRNAINKANITIQHSIEQDSLIDFISDVSGWVKSSVKKSLTKKITPDPAKLIDIDIKLGIDEILENTKRVKSNRVHQVEFIDTIMVNNDYYCYHQVKFTLYDLEATIDYDVLFATLKISRNTIFSQGRPDSSANTDMARIMNDTFERKIRLFKGIKTIVQISSEEDSYVFLPTFESFNIKAEW